MRNGTKFNEGNTPEIGNKTIFNTRNEWNGKQYNTRNIFFNRKREKQDNIGTILYDNHCFNGKREKHMKYNHVK